MMSFFRNLTIRMRLVVLTGMLCLFTAAASWVGYSRLVDAGGELKRLYDRGLLPVQWMNDARAHINAIRGDLLAMIQSKDPSEVKSLIAEIERRRLLNNDNLGNYARADLSEFEKKRLEETTRHMAEYRSATDEAIKLVEQNRNEEAYNLYKEKVEGLHEEFNAGFVDLAAYCVKSAEESNAVTERHVAAAVRLLIITAVTAVVLGILLGFFTERAIVRPLKAVIVKRGQTEPPARSLRSIRAPWESHMPHT